jgi:hypothetical protein
MFKDGLRTDQAQILLSDDGLRVESILGVPEGLVIVMHCFRRLQHRCYPSSTMCLHSSLPSRLIAGLIEQRHRQTTACNIIYADPRHHTYWAPRELYLLVLATLIFIHQPPGRNPAKTLAISVKGPWTTQAVALKLEKWKDTMGNTAKQDHHRHMYRFSSPSFASSWSSSPNSEHFVMPQPPIWYPQRFRQRWHTLASILNGCRIPARIYAATQATLVRALGS